MTGREERKENDLFFVCSLIEFLGRKTKNKRDCIIAFLGDEELNRLYSLADVFHSEPFESLAVKLIAQKNIPDGDYDNAAACKYAVPTHFDMGKVYKRLILAVADRKNIDILSALKEVYASPFALKLNDYNSSLFYENPEYVFASYLAGGAIED